MGPNQPNIKNDQLNNQSTISDSSTTSHTASKPKSSKALIWCLSIFAIIATVAAATFACLYFSGLNTQNQPQVQDENDIISPSPESESASTAGEEVEITDTYILRDLDEKIAILHLSSTTEPTIVKYLGVHPELPLYSNGNLSEAAKLPHVANSLLNSRYISPDEKESIIANHNYSGVEAEIVRNASLYGIDGNVVRKKYLDVFGEELVPDTSLSFNYCPYYAYNATYDFYYIDPNGGCGGTSPAVNYYYKNTYTTDGNHAYVYVSAATLSMEDSNVYCDVVTYDSGEKPEVCGTFSDYEDFTLDETNYQGFAEYRFVFDKATDGTYYFEKVEKL